MSAVFLCQSSLLTTYWFSCSRILGHHHTSSPNLKGVFLLWMFWQVRSWVSICLWWSFIHHIDETKNILTRHMQDRSISFSCINIKFKICYYFLKPFEDLDGWRRVPLKRTRIKILSPPRSHMHIQSFFGSSIQHMLPPLSYFQLGK